MGAIAAVALLVLLFNRGRTADTPTPVAEVNTKSPRADKSAEPEPPVELAAAPTLAPPSPDEQQANDPPARDGLGAIKHLQEINRYPSSSRRLTPHSADLLNPNGRHETRRLLPDSEANADRQWEVLFTADRYFVRGHDPVQVSLELWHEGREVTPRGVVLTANRAGAPDNTDSVALPVKKSAGTATATFIPGDRWPTHVGQIRVEARFSADGLAEQTGSLPFYLTSIERLPAEFTGEFSDQVIDGNLVVDVGVRVDQPGKYRVEGNLFDLYDNPVAWAAFNGDLGAGEQAPALKFYGLVFHDAGLAGPFVLRQIRGHRLRPGDSPHREDMADYPGYYPLDGHYEIADFTSAEYDSPWKQRMLKFYKEALARGVQLTEPGTLTRTAD